MAESRFRPVPNEGDEAYVELSFSPNAQLVATVRRFVIEFYEQVISNGDLTARLAVATHELLENAVRHSIDGNTSVRISVRRVRDGFEFVIETKNRTDPTNLDIVKKMIDEIAAAPDADAHYQLLMMRSAKRAEGSGLGLGRIRAEAEMQITHHTEGDVVIMRAHARIPTQELS